MTLSSISTPLTENYDVLRDYLDSQRLRGRRMSTISAYEQFLVRFLREMGKPVQISTGE